MDLGLRGRAAFVPAGSRGLGYAIAAAFGREGCDIGICARDEAVLGRAADGLRRHASRVVSTAADLTDTAQLCAAVDSTADALGRLDILVVNAGGPPTGTFEMLGDEKWASAFEITLMSAVRLIRHSLPLLRKSDAASIVVVSSASVVRPIAGLLLSNSLRRAVTGLVESLAVELAPQVRINSVLPSSVRTERTDALAASRVVPGGTIADVMAETAKSIPLGRYGEPDELARVAVFLASPAASYVTGVEIPVDGGKLRSPL